MTSSNTINCVVSKKKHKRSIYQIDKCLGNICAVLVGRGIKTLASCCGHGKYKPTIIFKDCHSYPVELFTGIRIPREKRFYFKDKQGLYYIPEVENIASHPTSKEVGIRSKRTL